MAREIKNEYGKIIISNEVFSNLAGTAAMECYGLVGMASQKFKDGLVELLGMETLSKGVEISFKGEQLVIDLYIIVSYGIKISEVAHNIMEKVRYAIESMTGVIVSQVNINIQSVRVAE